MIWNICCGLISFAWIVLEVKCQVNTRNNPPTMRLERNWKIPELEPVGSKISQVYASDLEGVSLTYGLEPIHLLDPVNTHENLLPFRIDSYTGAIYLDGSLEGRAGEDIPLYVTVSDGDLTSKSEVFVNIINGNRSSFPGNKTQISSPSVLYPDFIQRPSPIINTPLSPIANNPFLLPKQHHIQQTSATNSEKSSSILSLKMDEDKNELTEEKDDSSSTPKKSTTRESGSTGKEIKEDNQLFAIAKAVKTPQDITVTVALIISASVVFL